MKGCNLVLEQMEATEMPWDVFTYNAVLNCQSKARKLPAAEPDGLLAKMQQDKVGLNCTYICTYIYVYIHIYTYIYIYLRIDIYTYIYGLLAKMQQDKMGQIVHTYVHIYTYTYIYIHIYTCRYIYIHIWATYKDATRQGAARLYIHIYIYIRIDIFTYIYLRIDVYYEGMCHVTHVTTDACHVNRIDEPRHVTRMNESRTLPAAGPDGPLVKTNQGEAKF